MGLSAYYINLKCLIVLESKGRKIRVDNLVCDASFIYDNAFKLIKYKIL